MRKGGVELHFTVSLLSVESLRTHGQTIVKSRSGQTRDSLGGGNDWNKTRSRQIHGNNFQVICYEN